MSKGKGVFACDGKTFWLLAVLVVGSVAAAWAHRNGLIPFWLAVVIGTLLMNYSFTVWHETSHGNFSRSPFLNHAAGIVSSIFSIYPGYFARRREHLAHHRWEGDPALDPVYPRIQGSVAEFFVRLTWLTLKRSGKIEPGFLPLSEWQKRADRLSLGVFAFVTGLSIHYDFFPSIAAIFLLPRLLVFYLHAFYICYVPHAKPEGGFEKYRVVNGSAAWRAFTAGQWAHGVHHRWPNIPWHQYRNHLARLSQEEGTV